MNTLKDLFFDTLADVYDAEQQIVEALPKMSEAAQSPDLKEAIDTHLSETEGHVQIVEQVFRSFGEEPRGKKCKATKGLLEEGEAVIQDFEGSTALDAAIISAAQKVEHYEMACYGCLHTWAGLLGNEEAADLLAGILDEEKLADATLTELALAQSNEEALDGEDADFGEEEGVVHRA